MTAQKKPDWVRHTSNREFNRNTPRELYPQTNLKSKLPSEFAVKIYCKDKMKTRIRKKIICNELEALAHVNHPRVIQFLGNSETLTQKHILMEYLKGQGLESFLKRFLQKRVPLKMARPILKQILEGLEYLHDQNIFHRGRILIWFF